MGVEKDYQKIYRNASCLMLTSKHEGFGLVLIEAQAAHIPVIAFDSFISASDIIHNGSNGFLIKPFNILEFVEKLNLILENHDAFSSNAFRIYNEKFNEQIFFEK